MPAAWAGPGGVYKMSSAVVPSVSDGGSEPLAERERYTGKVLHAMCPICPECLRRRITVVLNDTPKCRSEEARECGSEKWKARKVVNTGNAERGARMSGMIAKLKHIVLNDTPKCRNEEARECGSEKREKL